MAHKQRDIVGRAGTENRPSGKHFKKRLSPQRLYFLSPLATSRHRTGRAARSSRAGSSIRCGAARCADRSTYRGHLFLGMVGAPVPTQLEASREGAVQVVYVTVCLMMDDIIAEEWGWR